MDVQFFLFTEIPPRKFEDPSAKRYIMSFVVGHPFLRQDVEFVVLTVEGQGFMVHQIRKMIGEEEEKEGCGLFLLL